MIYKTVVEMTEKSKSLSHEPFKVSRIAFAHPVCPYVKIYFNQKDQTNLVFMHWLHDHWRKRWPPLFYLHNNV